MKGAEWTRETIEEWVQSQSWYQTIPIRDGLSTPGTVDSVERLSSLEPERYLAGRSVLDVGSNSGMYCFEAKRLGARRVVGIEPSKARVEQAEVLKGILGLDVEFFVGDLLSYPAGSTFDTVLCFAVLTEVEDLLGALRKLELLTAKTLFIELDIPELSQAADGRGPIRLFRRLLQRVMLPRASTRLRRTKSGWSLAPNLPFLREFFGPRFRLTDLGRSVRYRLLRLDRTPS